MKIRVLTKLKLSGLSHFHKQPIFPCNIQPNGSWDRHQQTPRTMSAEERWHTKWMD